MTRRAFALAAAILFAVSWIFPIAAGLIHNTENLPRWWGPADVTLAFSCALSAFAIQASTRRTVSKRDHDTAYVVYRTATHALIVTAVLVMIAGDRIVWSQCATGFLWRSWLGLYILPWWLAAIRPVRVPTAANILE